MTEQLSSVFFYSKEGQLKKNEITKSCVKDPFNLLETWLLPSPSCRPPASKCVRLCLCASVSAIREGKKTKRRSRGYIHLLCVRCSSPSRRCAGVVFFFFAKDPNAVIICSPSSKLFFPIWAVSVLISIFCWLAFHLLQSVHTETHTHTCTHREHLLNRKQPNTCILSSPQVCPHFPDGRSASSSSPLFSFLSDSQLVGLRHILMTKIHLLHTYTHTHAHVRTRTQTYSTHTYTHLSFFVAFADIKKKKAAGSMQNNEVKAILISLGDEPNASVARGMRNEEEKE